MSSYVKTAGSARIKNIIDHAANPGGFVTWKLTDDELACAAFYARWDARTLERAARKRRKALRFLTFVTQRRATLAAFRAEECARTRGLQAAMSLQAAE